MTGGLEPPPLEVILSWPPANYDNPQTRGNGLVVMESVLLGFSYIIVALRVYSRLFQAKNFGIDDALIVFNLLPLTGLTASLILAFTHYGWDRHVWDVRPEVMVDARKAAMAIEITYLFSTCTTKVSILLFYRRLGGAVSPRFRYCIYAAIGFVVAYCIAMFVDVFVQCRPVSAFWNQGNPFWRLAHEQDFQCDDEPATVVAACVISMVQDFIACLLPMGLFGRLRIAKRKKVALGAIFGVGFFLCICGVLRLIQTVRVYYHTYDLTWESYTVWIWTGIESHMAVVCASLPAMNHFFRNVLKDTVIGSSLLSRSNKNSGGTSGDKSKESDYSTAQMFSMREPDTWRSPEPKSSIQVTQTVKLADFLSDKSYDVRHLDIESQNQEEEEEQWAQGTNYVDRDSYMLTKSSNATWLEDETSSGEERLTPDIEPSRKYSGYADSRRFY